MEGKLQQWGENLGAKGCHIDLRWTIWAVTAHRKRNSNMLKKVMILTLAGALAGGVATSAQARGGGMGHVGGVHVGSGVGMAGTNMGVGGSAMVFHQRAPATSTTCNLNPGYLYHPCF
jgi:hypothetical protein